MNSAKLTPLEVLQKQKADLRLKSSTLTESLENELNYIQHNFGTIISNTVVEGVVSKTPPFVQSLLVRNKKISLIESVSGILPFFIKGSRGWILRLVLDQARKWIFKRK